MRITGGKARGIPLSAPKGDQTRPATDRMREAVFSSLGPLIEEALVADLFAGTGAYGLEALSRGARSVDFYERDKQALQCLKRNLAAVQKSCQRSTQSTSIIAQDLFKCSRSAARYDYFFVDPPYGLIESQIGNIFQAVVEPHAMDTSKVIFELPGQLAPEIPGWVIERRLGKTGRDKPTAIIFARSE